MQVFICAAGKSTRLSKITDGVPKPLLKINKCSILEYLLKMVAKNQNVEEINIIVGYKKEMFKSAFADSYQNIPIKYHFNPEFETTGNLFSLYCAKDKMKDDVVFMTSDLIIEPKLVESFLNEEQGNKVLTDSRKDTFSIDSVKVKTENSIITDMSKDLSPEMADGVAIGLYRMNEIGKNNFFNVAKKILSTEGMSVGFI